VQQYIRCTSSMARWFYCQIWRSKKYSESSDFVTKHHLTRYHLFGTLYYLLLLGSLSSYLRHFKTILFFLYLCRFGPTSTFCVTFCLHICSITLRYSWPDFRTQRSSSRTQNVSRHFIGNNTLICDPGNHM